MSCPSIERTISWKMISEPGLSRSPTRAKSESRIVPRSSLSSSSRQAWTLAGHEPEPLELAALEDSAVLLQRPLDGGPEGLVPDPLDRLEDAVAPGEVVRELAALAAAALLDSENGRGGTRGSGSRASGRGSAAKAGSRGSGSRRSARTAGARRGRPAPATRARGSGARTGPAPRSRSPRFFRYPSAGSAMSARTPSAGFFSWAARRGATRCPFSLRAWVSSVRAGSGSSLNRAITRARSPMSRRTASRHASSSRTAGADSPDQYR